jgi:hypothetical protein
LTKHECCRQRIRCKSGLITGAAAKAEQMDHRMSGSSSTTRIRVWNTASLMEIFSRSNVGIIMIDRRHDGGLIERVAHLFHTNE